MLLIDGYYLDGYRGVPLYLNKVVQGLRLSQKPILCVKKSLRLSHSIKQQYRVVELPNINYILWEQLLIPIIAIKMKVKKVWSPANTLSIFLLFSNINIILTLHDLIFFENYSMNTHFFQKIGVLYRRFVWQFFRKFRNVEIISVSKTTKIELRKKFGLNSTVIYHGIDLPENSKVDGEFIDSLPHNFCLHLGSISPSKGTDIALSEFLKCDQLIKHGFKCIVLGKLYSSEFAKTYLKNDAFIFLDYVSDNNLVYLFRHCRLFLSTSIKEGFGFVPLEAILSGAPTLALKSDIADEILGNIGVPTVPREQFSEKIHEMAIKENHDDFTEACKNYYQWSKSVEKHQRILS
tara:strand:+ start:1235 stop:2281 length:1047 start_codon:yes stop_codon:yes gene_type:complete